jgi:two-component system response regulator ResD
VASASRVLVVDDEHALRGLLRLYLEKEGFAVLEAANGQDALSLLLREDIDVALIDVMLPEIDGFELVRRIRLTSGVPIILLTARAEETDRVTGLSIGADDYVVKPFSAPEVVARVRAQLRRAHGFTAEQEVVLRVGGLELDRRSRRCTVGGALVDLTRREFDLLTALCEQPGRVFSRESLLEAAWGSTFLQHKTVDVHVASLRRKLLDAVQITALRGVGYRLEP